MLSTIVSCFVVHFATLRNFYERGNYPLGLGRLMSGKQEKGL